MAQSRVTVTLQDIGTYKVFSIQGTGPDIATARAEAQKKLALIAGVTVMKVTEATELADLTAYPANAGTANADATLTLRKGSDRSTTRTINVPAVWDGYANATSQDGSIDVSNDDIAAFGTAYRDADGTGGYTVIRGMFSN